MTKLDLATERWRSVEVYRRRHGRPEAERSRLHVHVKRSSNRARAKVQTRCNGQQRGGRCTDRARKTRLSAWMKTSRIKMVAHKYFCWGRV